MSAWGCACEACLIHCKMVGEGDKGEGSGPGDLVTWFTVKLCSDGEWCSETRDTFLSIDSSLAQFSTTFLG